MLPGRQVDIEFHGCYWHGCPTCYKDRTKIVHSKTVDDLLLQTDTRAQHVRNAGYEYIAIWGCEYSKTDKLTRWLESFVGQFGLGSLNVGVFHHLLQARKLKQQQAAQSMFDAAK